MRTHQIGLKLTADEAARVERLALVMGIGRAELVRHAIKRLADELGLTTRRGALT